jgi:hypothetical protein
VSAAKAGADVAATADIEFGDVYVQDDGTVNTKGTPSTSFSTTDTDMKLCVFKSGTQAVLRNRLGSTKFLIGRFIYQ